jgi:uncharacterized membrane protein YbaN (DUF454 family)
MTLPSRQITDSPTRRAAWLVMGWVAVGIGTIGIFVPILPTTCFLLLAGAAFARSSPRAWHWLHHNRVFGRYLREYREGRVIPMRIKVASLAVLWLTIGATVIAVDNLIVRVLVLLVAVVVTAHVVTTASRRIEPVTARTTARDATS